MQHDADLLYDWLCRNVLTINTLKTCYMTFGSAKVLPDLNIKFDGTAISRVRQYKYLGIVLDEELSFNKHVDHVQKLVRPFIYLMWLNGKFIPVEKLKQIYFAYVHSHLTYMLAIYGECGTPNDSKSVYQSLVSTTASNIINVSVQHWLTTFGWNG